MLLGAGPVVVVGLGLPLAEGLLAAPGALRVARRGQPVGAALAVVALVLELVAMVLAVQWALAQHAAIPALSVDDMARTHGLLNGLGFVIAGLAGWSLVEATDPRGAPLPSRR